MLRMKTLLLRTPRSRFDRKRRNPVIAKVTKSVLAIDEGGLFLLMHGKSADVLHVKERHSPVHLVLSKLYFDEDELGKKTFNNPKTFIFCDCQDFTFRCEVALAIRGSSAVINSNGALPKFTNPSAIPQLCSHALAFLEKCLIEAKQHRPVDESKKPVVVRSDRQIIEGLKRPTAKHPNMHRMFQQYYNDTGISGTRH